MRAIYSHDEHEAEATIANFKNTTTYGDLETLQQPAERASIRHGKPMIENLESGIVRIGRDTYQHSVQLVCIETYQRLDTVWKRQTKHHFFPLRRSRNRRSHLSHSRVRVSLPQSRSSLFIPGSSTSESIQRGCEVHSASIGL